MTLLLFDCYDDQSVCLESFPDADRSWCKPSHYDEVVGVDFGASKAYFYKAKTGAHGSMPEKDFLSWVSALPARTLVVTEWAHCAVPRRPQSLAQPYTESELFEIYARCERRGILLRFAPHSLSNRMRLWAAKNRPDVVRSEDKSDAADAASIALYVLHNNGISLAKPPQSFTESPQRAYGRAVRRQSNIALNAIRRDKYKGNHFPKLSDLRIGVITRLGLKDSRVLVTSIVSTVAFEQDRRICLLTYNGNVPGFWFWKRYVFRGSPWHHKGGTARSNIMYHAYKKFLRNVPGKLRVLVGKDGKVKKFFLMTDEQEAARKIANRDFRSLQRQIYRCCIDEAKKMNADFVEATSIE